MARADNKTQAAAGDVDTFLAGIEDAGLREDSRVIAAMMARLSGEPPTMWGSAMVGFGSYHYQYDSGREGDFFRVGFGPRKRDLSLHLMGVYSDGGYERRQPLLDQLGKHKRGKSCLYIKQLSDVDMEVLEALVADSLAVMDRDYPR
ncbi:MAG: DUF1801 domain-containing protein [Sphingomonadales bacterium]|nr:DUF1801 domain-containing protein [Sphingomonadales bacterium]